MNLYQAQFEICIPNFATLGWAETREQAEAMLAKEQVAWPNEKVVLLDHEGEGEYPA